MDYNSKVDTITAEISKYKTDISNSKHECVRLLDDSLNLGAVTLADLSVQSERLDVISDNLRKIESTVYNAEKTVTKMEWREKHPFLSLFIGKWVKKPKWFGSNNTSQDANEISEDNINLSVRGMYKQKPMVPDDDDAFINTVNSKVEILKHMALDMGSELDKQNDKITEIIEHTTHVTTHVDKTRDRVGKLIAK